MGQQRDSVLSPLANDTVVKNGDVQEPTTKPAEESTADDMHKAAENIPEQETVKEVPSDENVVSETIRPVEAEKEQVRLGGIEPVEALGEEALVESGEVEGQGRAQAGETLVEHLLQRREQHVGAERLHDPTGRAGVAPAALHVLRRLRGEHEDRGELELRQVAQALHQVDAVHARHVDVGDHQVEFLPPRGGERLRAVLRLDHVVPCVDQREADHLTHGGGVVDYQDPRHVWVLVI